MGATSYSHGHEQPGECERVFGVLIAVKGNITELMDSVESLTDRVFLQQPLCFRVRLIKA